MAQSKVTIKLSNAGFQRLRTSSEVSDYVHEFAEELADRTGEGATAFQDEPRNRARSAVVCRPALSEKLLLALGEMTGQSVYTTKAGNRRLASNAQISNWTRGSRS